MFSRPSKGDGRPSMGRMQAAMVMKKFVRKSKGRAQERIEDRQQMMGECVEGGDRMPGESDKADKMGKLRSSASSFVNV